MTTEQPAPPAPSNPAFDDDLIDYSDHEEDYISPVKSRFPSPSFKTERVVVTTTVSELATVAVDSGIEKVDFGISQATEASEPADDSLHPGATSPSADVVVQTGIITPAGEMEPNDTEDASGDPADGDEVFKIDYEDDVDGDYSGIIGDGVPEEDDGVSEQTEFVTEDDLGPINDQPVDDWGTESNVVETRDDGVLENSATAEDPAAEVQVDGDFEESETQVGHDDGLPVGTVGGYVSEDEITYDDEDQVSDHISRDAQHPTVDAQTEVAQEAADSNEDPARDDGQNAVPDPAYEYTRAAEYADEQGEVDGPVAPETDAGDVDETNGLESTENGDDGCETEDHGSRPVQREDLDDALDSIMQSAHEHRHDDDMEDDEAAWPAVTVSYKGDEYPMFSPSDNLGFFSDTSILGSSMDSLLAAFRAELSEELDPNDELVLQIDELGLEYSESMDNKHLELVNLGQIIDLQSRLIMNQSADPSRGLYAFLFTKPNPSSRLRFLLEAAGAAKGLDAVARYFQPPVIEFAGAAMESHDTDSASEEYGGEDDIDQMDDEPDTVHEEDASAHDSAIQDDEPLGNEVQDDAVQGDDVQDDEVQGDEVQDGEVQDDEVQEDDVQDYDARDDQVQAHADVSVSYNETLTGDEDEYKGEGEDDEQHAAVGDDQQAQSGHNSGFEDDGDNEVGATTTDGEPYGAGDYQQPHSEHDEELEVDLEDDDLPPVDGETGNEIVTDDASHGAHDEAAADELGDPSQAYDDTDAAQQDDDGDQDAIDWLTELPNNQQENSTAQDRNAMDQESDHSSMSSTLDGDVVQPVLGNSENVSSFQFDENEIDWREEGDLVDDAPQEEIKSRSPSGATKRYRVEDELLDSEDGQDAKRRRP
jgi:hypothetical protein